MFYIIYYVILRYTKLVRKKCVKMATIRKYKKKNNEIVYRAEIRIKGFAPIRKTFYASEPKDAKKKAELWAKETELAMNKGTFKVENIDNKTNIKTVEDLIIYFRDNVAKYRYSHFEKYNCMYDWWIDKIGKVKISDLTRSMLTSCKQLLISEKIKVGEKVKNRGNNTINKYLMCISAVLTYGTDELELFENNPMSRIKTLPKPKKDPRFLSDAEIEELKKVCLKHSLRLFIFFMILLKTGGRFNEVRHLKVEDVDCKNCRVYYLNTKNGTNRSVHLDKNIIDLIFEYLKENNIAEGYIFKSTVTGAKLLDMKGWLEQAIKDANVKNFRIHDIRHTTASILAKNGATLLEIAEILGQTSLTVTRLYSHLTRKHTEELLASVMDKY